ncbi:MAG: hypothetical protein H7Z43_14450, partial [Clostridia bacterium]|nr:hypothetical protein [Deltaproteobacteria bacterium]
MRIKPNPPGLSGSGTPASGVKKGWCVPFLPKPKAVADVRLLTGFSYEDRFELAAQAKSAIKEGRRADPRGIATMSRDSEERKAAIRETLLHLKVAVATDGFLQMHGVSRSLNDLIAHMQTDEKYEDWRPTLITAFDFPSLSLKTPFHADKMHFALPTQNEVRKIFETHRGVGLNVSELRTKPFNRVHLDTEMVVGW